MPAERLKTLLDQNGIRYQTIAHKPTFTSAQVAEAAHVAKEDLAKPVVLRVDGEYVMAVLPASCRMELRCFRAEAGAWSVTLAEEDEFALLFPGCELGAEPPMGNLFDMPVWVDERLTHDASIVFNAGTHTEALRMAYADFERLAHPKVGRFALPVEPGAAVRSGSHRARGGRSKRPASH